MRRVRWFLGSGALQNFIDKTKDKTPEERGDLLAFDEEIRKIHDGFAQQGQTEAPGEGDRVDFHFISFLNVDNHVWSLDGMRAQPTDRGATSQETFLKVRPSHFLSSTPCVGHVETYPWTYTAANNTGLREDHQVRVAGEEQGGEALLRDRAYPAVRGRLDNTRPLKVY